MDMREALARARLVASPSPLHHPGAQLDDFFFATVARACPLPGARAHDSIRESGATRSTLPCRGASLASASGHTTGVHLVLASDATAWSLHPGKRRNQRGDHAGSIGARLGTSICSWPPRARRHALAAFPPAASFPPGPPNLGTPLIARLLRKLAK